MIINERRGEKTIRIYVASVTDLHSLQTPLEERDPTTINGFVDQSKNGVVHQAESVEIFRPPRALHQPRIK